MRKMLAAALAIAICGDLQSAYAADSHSWAAGDSLLKPAPADHSPFLPKAEAVARTKFPELFAGKFTGTIGVYVDLNIDAEVLSLNTIQFPAGPITDRSLSKEQSDTMTEIMEHDTYHEAGAQGTQFLGWFGAKRTNGLYLYYRVLKWPVDPSRSAAQVRSAVAKRYPQFHTPRALERNADESKISVVTVVMNNNGAIDDAVLVENASEEEFSDRNIFDRYRALGVKPEQLAYRGRTTNRGIWQDTNLTVPLLVIQYAWRRVNGDPPDQVLRSTDAFERTSHLHLLEQQNHPPDEEFLKRYFPDIWKNGLPAAVTGVWLLLARTGEVLDIGTANESDHRAIEEQIQKRHFGAKTNEGTITGATTRSGSIVPMSYLWIAADSLVIPKSSVKAD